MNVFFFFIGVPTPIFETELELIRNHDKSGDKVYVLQCQGNLETCHWNFTYSKNKCAECRSRFKNGWSALNPSENIELKKFPPMRKLSFEDVPQNFDSVEELKSYRYDGEKIGYGIASSLISRFRDHRFDTNVYCQDILKTLRSSVHVYETLKNEFRENKPDRLYVFNGRIANHLPAILLCKRMDIEYYTYEVPPSLNRYLLQKNATIHDPYAVHEQMEQLWLAEESDREKIAKSWFEQQRAGAKNNSIISYTQHQKKDLLPDGFDPEKKNIAIFNGTIDEYAAIDSYDNPIYSPDETAGIGRILEDFQHDNRYMFYLRVHPHMKKISRSRNSQLRDIDLLASRFSNLCVIWPAEIIDSYALLDSCEKVITFGSTMGVEAAYWGKPSILAGGQSLYKYLGCVYLPKSHEEVVKLLKQENLPPLPTELALKYGYRQLSLCSGNPFKYFKKTGRNSGTFDGIAIQPDVIPWVWFKVTQFFRRVKIAISNPRLLRSMLTDK
ncbi:MAG: hypothetical protein KKE17_07545 [Proteobacteria bacterium]|nr:hypothetical protein [Pseudomonadota bacterium]MBU1709841.1 hypothetical protein [Pseudomonadota bacterium]